MKSGWLAAPLLACLSSGCTAVDFAHLPTHSRPGEPFITQSGLNEPYDSVGLVQITRRGARAFGFADPAGTDLAAITEELLPEIRRANADGMINARFIATPITTTAKILGLIFFFAPLPTEVTVCGELVRFRRAPPQQRVPETQPGVVAPL